MSINGQLNTPPTQGREIGINEFCQEYIDWIEESNYLLREGGRYTSEGKFSSSLWIILNDVSKTHNYIDWTKFDFLLRKGIVTPQEISIIKCWIIDSIREKYSNRKLERMFSSILATIEVTQNFSLDVLNIDDGNVIITAFANKNSHENYYIGEYVDFLDRIDLVTKGHLVALEKLMLIKMYDKSNVRKLPKSRDIFTFHHYLNRFFVEETNVHIINFFMPLLMWWKITNVIPMRPSEFTYKLKRNCLSSLDGEYYLHIGRVKVSSANAERKEGHIPLLHKIKITKEIFELVSRYIEITSFDANTKTLISYEASQKFRREFLKSKKMGTSELKLRHYTQTKKYNDTYTREDLVDLINNFYDVVIEGKYQDNSTEKRIAPGDTRHLAFMSLLLQGISPIEIAMLGGHTTLDAQFYYTGHVEYYIDSEILNYISNLNIDGTLMSKSLKEIIFSKSYTCPKLIDDCSLTEDGIGYCTIDFDKSVEVCDNVELCIYCSKWWCEPTNENYIKAKKYIEQSTVGPLKKKVAEEQQFLTKLFSCAKVINVEGLLDLDKESNIAIKQATLKLQSTADKIIFYRKSLLEMFGSKFPFIK
jgi:hypothetical protein